MPGKPAPLRSSWSGDGRIAGPKDVRRVLASVNAARLTRNNTALATQLVRPAADDLAGQAAHPDIPVWILTGDDEVTGCTTLLDESPEWMWTDAERAEPALFMTGTVTDPRFAGQRLGCRLAWWVLDHAARTGRTWVRRGTVVPELVRYYRDVQGWQVVRERERGGHRVAALTRRAARMPDLDITAAPSAQ